jgi:hypothetical protein
MHDRQSVRENAKNVAGIITAKLVEEWPTESESTGEKR